MQITPVCLIVCICIGLAGCQTTTPSPPPKRAETHQALRVSVVRPNLQAVSHTLKAVGSFLAEDVVTISAEVDGRIAQLLVDEGSSLKQGQTLVQLEQERPRLEVQQAKAAIQEARADLTLQQTTLKRQAELLKEQIISQQVYDNVVARAELAKARLARAQALLRLARKSLTDTTIESPLQGVITERHVAVGEYIKKGERLLSAIKTHPLKLSFTLPERYAGQIHTDQTVQVSVKAYPDRAFSGRIYFINPQVDPQTRALQIKARIDNQQGHLKPGFFADVHLILDTNPQALVLPQEAIVLHEDKALAYVLHDSVVQERTIEVGQQFDGKVEILSGLRAEERVVTSGNYSLSDGQAVEVIEETKRDDSAV